MMNPATVSRYPNSCAKAGARVFTGSEAKPTAATTIRNASKRGSARSTFSESRRRVLFTVSWGRGRITSSAPTKTRYEAELSRNEAGIPRYATDAAPATGPAARAML